MVMPYPGWVCWYTPSIPPLGRQRQAEISEFEVILVCIASSKPAEVTQWEPEEKTPEHKQLGEEG